MNEASAETVGLFAGLVERGEVGSLTLGIEATIAESFVEDRSRMTGAEIKRRFELCCKIFKVLRGDFHWSVDRIVSTLPRYLRCELDGEPWEPDKRSIWMPNVVPGR